MLETPSTYKHVRGLARGLSILSAFDVSDQEWYSVSELSEKTGLHRTSVKRLLETLLHTGFVHFDAVNARYSLALRIHELSVGYVDDERVVEAARMVLNDLNETWVWPIILVTFDQDAMLVRAQTHHRRPIIFERAYPGDRVPILPSGGGKVYLAHCDERAKNQIIAALSSKPDIDGVLSRNRGRIEKVINETRRQGYGTNAGEWTQNLAYMAVSVPILVDGHPLASLSTMYHRDAMSSVDIESQVVPFLKEAVARILEKYHRLDRFEFPQKRSV